MHRYVCLNFCVVAALQFSACGANRSDVQHGVKKEVKAASPSSADSKAKKTENKPPSAKALTSNIDCSDPTNKADPLCASKAAGGSHTQPQPKWLTPAIMKHTKVLHTGSAVVGTNTKSWVVSLELADDQTIDSCTKTLGEKIKPHFPELGEPEVGKDGRKTMRGESDDYIVSAICGMNNKTKKITAYIGVNSR